MNIEFSFMVTYIILLTTGTICFIEALRTSSATIRHIFNLETCISIVAGYFYSVFISKIKDYEINKKEINWAELNELRYLDWAITTPMMLIALSVALAYNIKRVVHLSVISMILVLNFCMLGLGYLGENKTIDKVTAGISSFIAFFMMFFILFYNYIKPKYHLPNYIFYGLYLVVWTIYGIVYFLDEEIKNVLLNILDVISKSLIGLGLWLYYTRIIVA